MIARVEQVIWVLDHQADIESDMSALHRIDDPMTLPGPRYFRLANRLAFYPGVMHHLAVAAVHREHSGTAAPPGGVPRVASTGPAPTVNVVGHGPGPMPAGARYTDGEQAALQANPVFRDLIDFGRG